MGIWSRVKKGLGAKKRARSATAQPVPVFEQLEPRLLLSADTAGLGDFDPMPDPFGGQPQSAIEMQLTPGGQSDSPTVQPSDHVTGNDPLGIFELLVMDFTSQSDTELETDSHEVDMDIDSENGTTVQSSDCPTEVHPDRLSLSQIETVSNLFNIQNIDEVMLSETVSLSSDSTVIPSNSPTVRPFDAASSSIENRGPPSEIVFVDSFLNLDLSLENVVSSDVWAIVIPIHTNGVQFISDTLRHFSDLSAIHIVSHGAPGQVFLGGEVLDASILETNPDSIAAWGDSLVLDGDLLIYGCSIGKGQVGSEFVQQLAVIADADVAASTNPTGHESLGGDWDLEISTGTIETVGLDRYECAAIYGRLLGLVINEIHADPASGLPGDANGDGTRGTYDDEFVEIVNDSDLAVDIAGWTLSDAAGPRHTFTSDTVVPGNSAIVVFGGGTPSGSFGGALVQTASSGTLGLNNGGDTIIINDGTEDQSTAGYGSEGGNNQSLTRDPDITGAIFVKHSTATDSGGTLFSPGAKIDGSPFAGTVSMIINEVDCDTPSSDTEEFIELYDGGVGNTDLTGLVLVLYKGSDDQAYGAFDLDGQNTNANGYFVIGNSGVPNGDMILANDTLRNGPDAVALYVGDGTDFPNERAITTTGLLDAIAYDTGDADDIDLLGLLRPGETQVNEDSPSGYGDINSMQRVPNGAGGRRNTSSYQVFAPTPGRINSIIEISPASAEYNEGDSGATSYVFNVTRTGDTAGSSTVSYATSGHGTNPAAANDFDSGVLPSATIIFGPTETTKTITIGVQGDQVVENTESFSVTLIAATGGETLATATATGMIINDDSATLSITAPTITEGDADLTVAFKVILDNEVDGGFDVAQMLTLGTAEADDLTVLTPSPISFVGTAGETQAIEVRIAGEEVVEADETFTIRLGDVTNTTPEQNLAVATGDDAMGTIENDDTATLTLTGVSTTQNEGTGGTTTAFEFSVALDYPVQGGLDLAYTTNNGTALVSDNDYVDNDGSLSFVGTGDEFKTITIQVNHDAKVETDETFQVALGDISGLGTGIDANDITTSGTPAIGTIGNDDGATLSINDVVLAEGDSGTSVSAFMVTLTGEVAGEVLVSFETVDGSATKADSDYNYASGTLNFVGSSGETQLITVDVSGDTKVEDHETFLVNLSDISDPSVSLADSQGQGTIANDDSATLSITAPTITEGDANLIVAFEVTLDNEVDGGFDLAHGLMFGTAEADDLTVLTTSPVCFDGNSGETQVIEVQITGDEVVEANETFTITLGDVTGTTIEQDTGITTGADATGTITNDDTASVNLSGGSANEAVGSVDFVVSFTNPVDVPVSVLFDTLTTGTATAGDDFDPVVNRLVTFAAGETSQVTSVTVADDLISEGDEIIYGQISSLSNGQRDVSVGTSIALATIANDDFATIIISLENGDLKIEDVAGLDDQITLWQDEVNGWWIIQDANNLITSTAPNTVVIDENTVAIPLDEVWGDHIVIDTLAGGDTLTIDSSLGDFTKSITYHGGEPSNGSGDALALAGDCEVMELNYINGSSGTILLSNNALISYDGLGPISSMVNVQDVIVNYSDIGETITIYDASSGKTTITSTSGETTTFVNPTRSLMVNAGGGDDTIELIGLAGNYPAHIVINGQGGVDAVEVDTAVNLAIDKDLTVHADAIKASRNCFISTSGLGSVVLRADRNIDVNAGATIETANGDVILEANHAGATPGSFVGMDIDGAMLESSGSGSILLTGSGGNTSSDDGIAIDKSVLRTVDGNIQINGYADQGTSSSDGVDVGSDSVIECTGAGSIRIEGRSGLGSSSDGVEISDVGIRSVGGAISINGEASFTGSSGDGVKVDDTVIQSLDGTITIAGMGSGQSSSEGVHVTGNQTMVTSVCGDILIAGNSGGDDDGVEIHNGAVITSTGTGVNAALITITGTGGAGTTDYGVELADPGTVITSVAGDITLDGASPGGDGIFLGSAVQVVSTGLGTDAALITIQGMGGGTSSDEGVHITGANTGISSTDGTILIIGDSGGDDDGVEIENGAHVMSTGTGIAAADIIIYGTGGIGTTDYGVEIADMDTHITAVEGRIEIFGQKKVGIGPDAVISSENSHAGISITTDDVVIKGTVNAGAGVVAILPGSPGLTYDLGSTSGSGQCVLTDDELNQIYTSNRILIGDATGGAITFTDGVELANVGVLELISGSFIADTNKSSYDYVGQQLILKGAVAPGQSPGILNIDSDLVLADNSRFNVEIGGNSPGATVSHHDQIDVSGTVTIGDQVVLVVTASPGFVPALGDTYVLINNDTADPVSGTFQDLAEGSAVSVGVLTGVISYRGGDGNDIVITMPEIAVRVTPASLLEDDAAALEFEFTRTGGHQTPLTIRFTVAGTADFGVDYTQIGAAAFGFDVGSLTFAQGQSSVIIRINSVADSVVEADETIVLEIADGVHYKVNSPDQAVATFLNDDSATLIIEDGRITEGTGAGMATLTLDVSLDAEVEGGFNVAFSSTPGTAETNDFSVNTSGPLTFSGWAGETQTINVDITRDAIVEANETFTITLGDVTDATPVQDVAITTGAAATGTIVNDDIATVILAGVSATQNEGTDDMTTAFEFTVTLDKPVDGGFDLAYTTNDGTATVLDNDYVDNDGSLGFSGTVSDRHGITILVNRDAKVEIDESFQVALGAISGLDSGIDPNALSTVGTPATGTIRNDDGATLFIDDVSLAEGDAGTMVFIFTVTLAAEVAGGVSVDYDTADESATTTDSDYASTSGTLNFGGTAGETQQITVNVSGDNKVEDTETFEVNLNEATFNGATDASRITIGDAQGIGTIENDDTASVSLSGGSVNEAIGAVDFTVGLSNPVDTEVTVLFNTLTTGTATLGSDFDAIGNHLVIFGIGEISKTVSVTVTDDLIPESGETIDGQISVLSNGLRNVSLGTPNAAATIVNDDIATILVSLENGNLTIEDLVGLDDRITLWQEEVNGQWIIHDPNNLIASMVPNSVVIDENTVAIGFDEVWGDQILIDTMAGDDTLTIDCSLGDFSKSISYHGGAPTIGAGDALVLAGECVVVELNYIDASSGTIQLSGNALISYDGLEPIGSVINAVDVILNYSHTSETIAVSDAGSGQTTVTSSAGEITTFVNPSGSLTINAGGGDDEIDLDDLAANYPAHVTVNGQEGIDTVDIAGVVNLAADKNLTVIADTIKGSGSCVIGTSGLGSVTLRADRTIDINTGASMGTVNGDIVLQANPTGATTGSFVGIDVDGATLTSAGSGSILMTAWGGDTSSDDGLAIDKSTLCTLDGIIQITGYANHGTSSADGVDIGADSRVECKGSGSIGIDGRSGSGSSSDGVEIGATSIRSVDGMISISGDAFSTDSSGCGVNVDDSVIESASGAITLDGTGSGHSSSEGVYIAGSETTVTSVCGDILITGNSKGDDDGVEIHDGAVIASTGTGANVALITITGLGGIGTTDYGIELGDAGTTITSVDGDIVITGTSPGGDGVNVGDGVLVSSSGSGVNAAQIAINGTGGGVGSSEGVVIAGPGASVYSFDGAIQILGDSGGDDDGVEIHNGAVISSNGAGVDAAGITIIGLGGSGTTDYGIELDDDDTAITAVTGDILITGTSPGGDGVNIGDGVVIASTGLGSHAAQIYIEGTGGGVSSSEGIVIAGLGASVTSVDGAIHITGNSGGDDDGIEIHDGTQIRSTGTGTNAASISITGIGGAGSTDYGLELADPGTVISSVAGDIVFNGTSPGGDGVYFGSSAKVSSTGLGAGAAQITIQGMGGGTSSDEGVHITGAGTTVSSIDGIIQIIGGSGGDDDGVEIENGAHVISIGTGINAADIVINGTNGLGTTDYSVEIADADTRVTAVDGRIEIIGHKDVCIGSGALVSSESSSAHISITTNDVIIKGIINAGSGVVSILPGSPGLTYDLGSTSGSGQCVLTDSELDQIFTSNRILIGDTTAGALTFTDTVDLAGAPTLELVSGAVIGDTNKTGYDFVGSQLILNGMVAPGQSPGILSVDSDVILADNSRFSVQIGGDSPGTTSGHHDQLDVVGMVTIGSQVVLSVNTTPGYVPTLGHAYVLITNDGTDSVNGTFRDLSEGAAVSIGSIMGTISYQGGDGNDVVITMTDVSVSCVSPTVHEDEAATLDYEFVRTGDTQSSLTIHFTVSGTAEYGMDYNQPGTVGSVTFDPGKSTAMLNIVAFSDSTVEAAETVVLTIAEGVPYRVNSPDQATGTILNDDTSMLAIASAPAQEGDDLIFTVVMSNAVQGGLTVNYQTHDGTATVADSDYVAKSGQLTFVGNAGEEHRFVVRTVADNKVEADEIVGLSLFDVTPLVASINATDIDATNTAVGMISNDDRATLTIADVAVAEDSGTLRFNVTLSHDVQGGLKVRKQTSDGTATTADGDYQYMLGTLTFTGYAGEIRGCCVHINPDTKVEANETFIVSLLQLMPLDEGVDVSNIDTTDTALCTILNDDTARLTIADVSQAEDSGYLRFNMTLSHDVQGGLKVRKQTSDGTATVADGDYQYMLGTLHYAGTAGEVHGCSVRINSDTEYEPDETFIISLLQLTLLDERINIENIDISDTAVCTILNDDVGPLEISLDNNRLRIEDRLGTDNDITLQQDQAKGQWNITDTANVLTSTIPNSVVLGPHVIAIPFTEVAGNEIMVYAMDGKDVLTIDCSLGNFTKPIAYYGGNPAFGSGDALVLAGDCDVVELNYVDHSSGTIRLSNNALIRYNGLEPINTLITAQDVILNYSDASETITISDAGLGQTTVTSTAGETTTFAHPTGSLIVNAGGGNDEIEWDGLAAHYPAHVTINGQGGIDTVEIEGAVNLASNQNLAIKADTIKASGKSVIRTSGSGGILLRAGRHIDINKGGVLATGNGDLVLEANSTGTTAGSFVGVDIDGAMLRSTGYGSILITGRGGDTSSDDGVAIDKSTISTVDGNIRIMGNAGAGTRSSDGVDIGSDSVIECIGSGSVTISGRSGTGSSSDGVEISDTIIRSTDGIIGISGDASNADSSSDGVELDDSLIESVHGAIQITGNSTHAGSSADGVDINDSTVQSATGHIQIMGMAMGAGSSADGIELAGGAIIRTTHGPITITGKGQLDGVYMTGTGTAISSAAGDIRIHGTGGGLSSAEGVHITGDSIHVTNSLGDIHITGISGGDDDGVEIENGACISSTGVGSHAGSITIVGTGGSGSTDYGVAVVDPGTLLSSVDGDIVITGNSMGGDGVYIGSAARIISTGLDINAAQIRMQGMGGGTSSDEGVHITGENTVVISVNGAIQITGGSGGDDDGVEIENGAWVMSIGTGPNAADIVIHGTNGIGTTDYSVEIADAHTRVNAVDGHIEIYGHKDVCIGSGAVVSSESSDAGISIITDDIILKGIVNAGGGVVALLPGSSGLTYDLGSTSGTGKCVLTDDELDQIFTTNRIIIGAATAGAITFTDTVDLTYATTLELISGTSIEDTNKTGHDFVGSQLVLNGRVAPGQSPGILKVDSDVVLAANSTVSVEIGGITPGTTSTRHDQINVSGAVGVGSNVALDLSAVNGFSPTAGDTYVVINNHGSDPVDGSFSGMPEGTAIMNFLDSGYMAIINYAGGDGNDVVITVPEVAVVLLPTSRIDTAVPVIEIDQLTTNDTTPQLTGTVDDTEAQIEVTVAGAHYTGTNNGDGTWTVSDNIIDPALQYNRTYEVQATATDQAGNVGSDTSELTTENPLVEQFDLCSDGFDLSYEAVLFTPNQTQSTYTSTHQDINSLPTNTNTTTWLDMDDDSSHKVDLTNGQTVSLYGQEFAHFYIGSNGYITFTGPGTTYSDKLENHFEDLRISALFNDLSPDSGTDAKVGYDIRTEKAVVTWYKVAEYGLHSGNTFQVEMYYDGRIRIAWANVSADTGIVGLSDGLGLHEGYVQTDFSKAST